MAAGAFMGMASSAMGGGGGGGQRDETTISPQTRVDVGGFTGGDFSINRSMFDGLNSKDGTTQMVTGAVMLGGVFVVGMVALKLLKGAK